MQSLLQLTETNFEGHISKAPSLTEGMLVFKSKGLTFVDSNLSEDTFNIIHINNSETLNIEELRQAIDYFNNLTFDFCIWVNNENLTPGLKQIFSQLSLSKQAEELGMVLNLGNYVLNREEQKLNIVKVNNEELLLTYATVLASHWHPINQNILQFYKTAEHVYLNNRNNIFLFLYYWENKPVGTIELYASDKDTIGIYGLTTLEQFRGKGIGTSLLRYALDFAKQKGFKNIILQATEDGFRLYKKIGFEVIASYYEYS